MDFETTIVAVSSPGGKSSHALVRASGAHAWSGAKKLGLQIQRRKLVKGIVSLAETTLPVLVGSFPATESFTGQDTVEIHLPNNKTLVDTVLQKLIVATKGRFAEAGEFTARAFLHGNISLSSAEGVCATISANNEAELQGAALLRGGALARATEPISTEITRALALVEAGIDFTDEEDVIAISDIELQRVIQNCTDQIRSILNGKIAMESLQNLPHVVLAGNTNAGKSTLFNALLGKKRAVISNVSGTTRDVIAEPTLFGGKEALLIDVAGHEIANDELSSSMQLAARRAIDSADIVLWCVAPSGCDATQQNNTIIVHTMGDLPASHTSAVSAATGKGIRELIQKISNLLNESPSPRIDALALLPRHVSSLERALNELHEAFQQITTPELTAASLREALNAIGTITGQVTPDEIIGEVFSTFCVGK